MKKRFFLLLLAAGAFLNSVYAQDCEPLPVMFLEKSAGDNRLLEFVNAIPSKFEKLTAANGKQDINLFYTRTAIDQLFTDINKAKGIRIYFGRYKKCPGSPLPDAIEEKKLILLFANEPNSGSPTEYYFINNDDDNIYKVQPDCAKTWKDDFETIDEPVLRETIGNNTDDADATSTTGFSDTRSILYTRKNIDQAFRMEEIYQKNHNQISITGFKISFAAYSKNGKLFTPKYKQRLHLQFDYLRKVAGKQEILELEDLPDYECRLDALLKLQNPSFKDDKLKKLSKKVKLAMLKLDNGLLCPTNCP